MLDGKRIEEVAGLFGTMTFCRCDMCEQNRRCNRILAHGNLEEVRALVNELRERNYYLEEALSFRKSILDGSWPSAREYALAILEKIAKREKDKEQ